MKKRIVYKLDIFDEDPVDIAYLLFHTSDPGYIFVDNLNRLCQYNLHRIDDMPFPPPLDNDTTVQSSDQTPYPFYTHSDPISHKHYFLIEKPLSATPSGSWQPADKLLIIKGESAALEAESILDDFTDPLPPRPDDLLAIQHAELRDQMLQAFTVVNLLDFSAPAPSSTRAARDRVTLEQHCNLILSYIERNHLDISEVERLRLSRQQPLMEADSEDNE